MSASNYVGRVGGLAVAFGVGAGLLAGVAVVANAGIATADPGASSSSGPSDSAGRPGRGSAGRGSDSTPRPAASAAEPSANGSDHTATARALPRLTTVLRDSAIRADLRLPTTPAVPTTAASTAAVTIPTPPSATAVAPVRSTIRSLLPAAAVVPTGAVVPTLSTTVAPRLRPIATMIAAPSASSVASAVAAETPPRQLLSLVVTGVVQLGVALAMAAVNYAPPAATKVTPTLVLNGYDLVPSNTLTVTSFYGRLSYFPGGLSVTQGRQRFDVVDPATSAPVGTFDALVTQGLGYGYEELLVTANDGTNVGTGAGQTPPVGSLISTMKIAKKLGWSYSAMPAPGGDVVSFKFLTPFGDIPVKMTFNAAKGIADHTVDNRPMDLTNGYYLAPADPNAEIITATTGILPLFGTVQGNQLFSVYDTDGNAVGSFDGVFTTTSDLTGIYTQALMVTGNDGVNVGINPGQVPPVGSVYNVIYDHDDENFFIYSSMPWPTGDVVSLIQHTPDKVANVTPTFIDASSPPPAKPLKAPGGYLFVPVSESVPSGVNGLPPREVEVQGYQRFDVYDKAGTKIGTVNADVSNQWDMFGIYSRAILVTDVVDGTAGTAAGNVPPVGSVYSFVYPGKGRFGTSHSSVPMENGDLTGYQFITPWGNIPVLKIRKKADRAVVNFYNPLRGNPIPV